MKKEFKTKAEAIKFLRKLYFGNIRYEHIVIGKRDKVWVVYYE